MHTTTSLRHGGLAAALICSASLVAVASPTPLSDGITSVPAPEAQSVSGSSALVVRFAAPMSRASLTEHNLTLVGPHGNEPVHVAALAYGMLAIVTPVQELLPASRYTLFVSHVAEANDRALPLHVVGFDTAPRIAEPTGPNLLAVGQAYGKTEWLPGSAHQDGDWRANRGTSPLQALAALRAADGVTALAGQVLAMDGSALPDVTLRVAGHEVHSDATGRFLLATVPSGGAKLEVDGASADQGDARYGYYAAHVDLDPRQTTVLPYTIWMPRLDPAGTVHLASPTTKDTVVTSPRIPGLELHIPAGTVIRDRAGKVITELNVTAIPVDRPPFPVPDLGVPTYFTVQPGGATFASVDGKPSAGARLLYPNFRHELPGARGTFWNYDPDDRGWFVYGTGTISANGKQALPDAGVAIHALTGAMFNGGNTPAPDGPPPCDCGGSDGDPVNLSTGQFTHTDHDMWIGDTSPLDIARTYDSHDKNLRAFGVGMTHQYDIYFYSLNQFQEVDLILPDNTRVHYFRTTPGNDTASAVFDTTAPGQWTHSKITASTGNAGWNLRFRDGRTWFFAQLQPISQMTDANGNVTQIVRENGGDHGKVTRVVGPNGRVVNFTYNAQGLVGQLTDNLGRSVTYTYDPSGRMTRMTDPLGGHVDYTWDTTNNRITAIHNRDGNLVIQNTYDGNARVSSQSFADGSQYNFAYGSNATGQLIDVTDRRGSVRRIQFDTSGYMVSNTFPLGLAEQQITTFEHTGGQLSARVDALGRRTQYSYDAAGNLTQITQLAGTANAVTTSATYDPTFNLPLTVTDPSGHTTSFQWDARGNLESATDALGHARTFTADAQGRPLTVTNALGNKTTWAYDNADLASITDALGNKTKFVTDVLGRRIATIDPLGHLTRFDLDALGRLSKSINVLGGETSFAYDADSHLLSYTDANNYTAGYTYNAIGMVQSSWDALFKEETRSYDVAGRVSQYVDRKGQVRAVSYDPLGRLHKVSYGATAAAPTAFVSQVENVWDAGDRLVQIIDRTCASPSTSLNCASVASTRTITRTYDGLDRLIREITPQGDVNYTYDLAGRRMTMVVKNGAPGSQTVQPTVSYSYDNADRLTQLQQAAGAINGNHAQTVTFAYDAGDRLTTLTFANGSTATYGYDNANHITSIMYRKADTSVIGDLQYTYDANGQTTGKSGSLAQLDLPSSDVLDATYGANSRLLTWAGKTFQYDDLGNLISDGTSTYQWNERNRLAAIVNGSTTLASFQYDSIGRRTSKSIGGATTGFVYDRSNVIQELAGTSNTSAVTAHMLAAGTDQVFLRIEGNTGAKLYSRLYDRNRNTLALFDANQAQVVSYGYEPYGVTSTSGTGGNAQQFAGRDNDNPGVAQGLYYYRHRYYMPGTGRFIAEDPLGWGAGQTNTYTYVDGDPINFIDPLGLDAADHFENFSAGFGDALTFGLGSWLRKKLGIDGVNTCSGWYTAGGIAGEGALLAATAGASAGEEAAAAAAEEEAEALGAEADGAENAPRATRKELRKASDEFRENEDFRDYAHELKQDGAFATTDGTRTNLNMSKEEIWEAWEHWKKDGSPTRGGPRGR